MFGDETVSYMDRFEAELDNLAEAAYRDLPTAADFADSAELFVARCDGLENRAVFVHVDQAWTALRDETLRPSLRRMVESLQGTAQALRTVHSRYGGADEAASLQLMQVTQERRHQQETKLDLERGQEALHEDRFGVDRDTAGELKKEAARDALEEDGFVPWQAD
jgi:hypothetical protein